MLKLCLHKNNFFIKDHSLSCELKLHEKVIEYSQEGEDEESERNTSIYLSVNFLIQETRAIYRLFHLGKIRKESRNYQSPDKEENFKGGCLG